MCEIHLHKLVMDAPLPWISSLAPSIWRSKGEERPTWIMLSDSSTYLASFPHNLDKATDLWPKLDKILSDHGYDNNNDVVTREAVGETLDRLWKEREKLNEEDQKTRAQMNEIGSQLPEYSGLFG
ncbi:hypothetical protein PENSPDRAFT_695226 [Peniophora sp. CONT]|nr:hypothetical protein PENSPDRAFT_695226 [Peniophora sp. CONT]